MASNHGGLMAKPVGRARPSAFDPNASNASVSSMNGDGASADLVGEHQEHVKRLELENFNLRLRIGNLEERLMHSQSMYTEDFEAELVQKRLEIEEKEVKIRQQKDHMMRAVDAIEQLKRQLAEAHTEIERLRSLSNQAGEMEVLRQVLARTEEELERRVHRVREVETEVGTLNEERAAFHARFDQVNEEKKRMESELKQLRQTLHQFDQERTKGVLQVEHLHSLGNQREKQAEELASRLEQITQEKLRMESKYQAQMKKMDDQIRSQVEKLKQDGEKYRNEYMKVSSERDKLQFERERFVVELESVKQDKARYQAEWERIAKDMERLNGEAEAIRLQNAKLNATCEHQAQTLGNYKSDRESALDNLHRLENEASEWRKRSSEQELAIKSLEMRCQSAEAEVNRLQERLEAVSTRHVHTTNDRLAALEQNKNALETENYELRKSLSSLQHQLESFESKCQSYDNLFNEEAEKAKEYKSRLVATERELRQRMAHSEQLERELAQLTNSSVSESARVQQYSEQITRITNERNQLMDTIATERTRLESTQKSNATLEAQNQHLTSQLMALAKEIQSVVGFDEHELSYRSLDALFKEGKLTLQRQFKADADSLLRRWQEQAESTRGEVDRLSSKLHSCHMKLESLQLSTLHAKDDAKSIDRSWLKKYETLRSESESVRRSLEDELRSEKNKNAQLETSLSQARGEVNAMAQARKGTMSDLERDIFDLQESNRLLIGELKERSRSAKHARKQHLAAVAENEDLLNAVKILKTGIVERDKQIESLKAAILRTTQQLQRGGSMVEVKQKLLQQLEQTQFMVNETYKKWSQSDIGLGFNGGSTTHGGDGDESRWVAQLDEYIGRLEAVCGRWGEHSRQSRDMHRRYTEAWRSAALSFGKGKERPVWVDGVERKCNHLLSESYRICEEMRDVVDKVVNVLHQARKSSERKVRRSRSTDHVYPRNARDPLDLSSRRENNHTDDALSLEHFDGDFDSNGGVDLGNNGNDDHEVLFINRGKRMSAAASRGGVSSRTSASRGGASAIYGHSLTTLSRISDELKAVEKKIKTYPDE